MQRTQQSALAQQTNQGLIAIRQWEIGYYSSFYYSFGAQSAVIGGFAYQALTQVEFPYSSGVNDDLPQSQLEYYLLCKELFWFFSAMCLAVSMLVMLTTIFIQIMGPRLSLYGPIGSMAKAADEMRDMVNEILFSFVIMILFFSLSTLMSFWVLMSVRAAIASSAIFILSSTLWWRYCSMIYNLFQYDRRLDLHRFKEYNTKSIIVGASFSSMDSHGSDAGVSEISVASVPYHDSLVSSEQQNSNSETDQPKWTKFRFWT